MASGRDAERHAERLGEPPVLPAVTVPNVVGVDAMLTGSVAPGPNPEPVTVTTSGGVRRVSRSASAVLFGWPRVTSTDRAKSLVRMLRAGTGTRTPGLLITSNLEVSGVHANAILYGTWIDAERKPPSYQLSWRATRRQTCRPSSTDRASISPAGPRSRPIERCCSGWCSEALWRNGMTVPL